MYIILILNQMSVHICFLAYQTSSSKVYYMLASVDLIYHFFEHLFNVYNKL